MGAVLVKQDQHTERISGDERFARVQRLRSSRDFQRVRRRGRQVSGPHLLLQYARQPTVKPTNAGTADGVASSQSSQHEIELCRQTRIGFSVSKRTGNAVTRNLIKRHLREATRRRLAVLVPGWDVVLTARPAAASAEYLVLVAEVDELLARANLWLT